jgi:hypothetical protein
MALDFAGGGDRLATVPRFYMRNRHRQCEVFLASTTTRAKDTSLGDLQPDSVSCPPAAAWWWARFQQCLFLLLVSQATSPLVSWAEDGFPPFMVEASITSKWFLPNPTNATLLAPGQPKQAEVTFYSSNGWWQVEVKNLDPRPSYITTQNSMKIPDGVREFFLPSETFDRGTTVAKVFPFAFPTPPGTKQILAWLSFCPRPPLPVIDGKKMHRFLFVPSDGIAVDLLNHPQNVGDYSASYLQPGGIFLSELNVTNNGVDVDIDMTFANGDNLEVEVKPFPAPGEKGFLDFRFEVLATTNCNGIAFPLRTVLKHFCPNWWAKSADDLYLRGTSELVVKRISFSASDLANRKPAPSVFVAYDFRPPDLPKNRSVTYHVTDDVWQPVSDPQIQAVARRLRRNADRYSSTETVDNDLNSKANQRPNQKSSPD